VAPSREANFIAISHSSFKWADNSRFAGMGD
jgi:hypothetical protein